MKEDDENIPDYFPFRNVEDAQAPKPGKPKGGLGRIKGGYPLRPTLAWEDKYYNRVQVMNIFWNQRNPAEMD